MQIKLIFVIVTNNKQANSMTLAVPMYTNAAGIVPIIEVIVAKSIPLGTAILQTITKSKRQPLPLALRVIQTIYPN